MRTVINFFGSKESLTRLVCTLTFGIILVSHDVAAQFQLEDVETAVLPPSPTASALGQYGEVPVSLSSGLPSISVPVTTFDAGDIQVPISLSYYSGGLKVDQSPSWVGMGWSLNAGGVITRTVKDRPDEPGQLPYPSDMAALDLEAMNYIDQAEDDDNIHFDSELDEYAFNFLGYSGKFVINRQGEALIYPRQNLRIERQVDQTAGGDNQLMITSSDGTKFYFGGVDGTEYSRSSWSGVDCGRNYDGFTETAYYLVKVEKTNGSEVLFEYDLYHHFFDVGISQTTKSLIQIADACTSDMLAPRFNTTTCTSSNEVKGRRLTKIYATGHGAILFEANSGGVLQHIKDSSGVQGVRKRFDLAYAVTTNNRLFLTSVIEKDALLASQKTHTFNYEDKEAFPALLSFDRDHWGYYNAAGNNTLLDGRGHDNEFSGPYPFVAYQADREPDLEATKKGVLTKITYPTGGSSVFDYELNQASVQELVYPPITHISKTLQGAALNGTPQITVETYQLGTLAHSQLIDYSATATALVTNPIHDNTWVTIIDLTDGTTELSINTQAGQTNAGRLAVIAGHRYVLQISAEREMQLDFELDYYSKEASLQTTTKTVGGLRLKRLVNHDLSGKDNIKVYHYGGRNELTLSSGQIRYQPHYFSKIQQLQQCEPPVSGAPFNGDYQTLIYGQLHSSSVRNLYLNGGSHISYTHVNVSHGENFEGGGQEHNFRVTTQTPGKLIHGHFFQNQPLNNSAWDNGQELEVVQYKKEIGGSPIILSKTTNEYYLDPRQEKVAYNLVINKRYDHPYQTETISVCDDDTTNDEVSVYRCTTNHDHKFEYQFAQARWDCVTTEHNNQWVDIPLYCYGKTSADTVIYLSNLEGSDIMEYTFKNYWSYLSKSTQTVYDENGLNPLTTVTDFVYDNPSHLGLSRQIMLNSQGKTVESQTKYPEDYAYSANSVTETMVARHITGLPVEKIKTVDNMVVSAQAVQYEHLLTDDLIVPKKFFTYDTAVPSASFTGATDGETFSAYRLTGTVVQRDDKGNILSLQKENDLMVSYVWGYQKSRVVAKIVNAAYADISGFVYDIQTASNADDDHCLASQTIFPGCQEDTLRSKLDWLRAAPALSEALITTYTYDPAIGLTSEKAPDGQMTYYEYDDLGRLKLIKDQNGHVLQAYDYRYANLSAQ